MQTAANQIINVASNITVITSQLSPLTSLIAVSKKQTTERIEAALAAGQRVFGENYVQEAQARWMPLKVKYPDLELHLIGPLQTNKVKDAVSLFDYIHTLDRLKLAQKIAEESKKQQKKITCFIQINTAQDVRENGVLPDDLPEFLGKCRDLGLDICGLMVLPPPHVPPEPHFQILKKLADAHGLQMLSMGMSADWQIALVNGATHIRVGTGIFGARL